MGRSGWCVLLWAPQPPEGGEYYPLKGGRDLRSLRCKKMSMFYNARGRTFRRAKELRIRMTQAEVLLWERLRRGAPNPLKGESTDALKGESTRPQGASALDITLKSFRFRRQHPIGRFIADFYCHKARLVIELDGAIHEGQEQKSYDKSREEKLKLLGLTVLRFDNAQVENDIAEVLRKILDHLQKARVGSLL